MSAEKSKKTPDKRRKYDDAFKAETLHLAAECRSTQAAAQQLGISPKLLYRWQEAKLVAEVGSVEVARDPEVRQLRAQLKRAEQELDILKKPWASSVNRRGKYLSVHRPAPGPSTCTAALPGAARGTQCLLCMAATSSTRAGTSLVSSCPCRV
ncbi:hypothetical protein GCM10023172_36790 [Hymenobacter ginsengisoli]|uniref:Transposase n=1 Tax=Hymenobacter ginsengisoli TaxID=1051626 RepID=A0ABP8QRK6_9BACT|nr:MULTISPECIES: transposase [unclassified Hymenobacter]MBO2033941.1 transposase [Hymenobacter sp. BT559]